MVLKPLLTDKKIAKKHIKEARMKLTTKLLLAFSTTIVLIIFISYLAWNATGRFDRQKNVLAYGDNIVASILKADKAAGAAISTNRVELFNEVKAHLQDIQKNCDGLLGIAHQEITREHLRNIKKTTNEYAPLIDKILGLFKQLHDTDDAITKIGYNIQDDLAAIERNATQDYARTGNADTLLAGKMIGECFSNVRLAIANFLISYSDESLGVVEKRVREFEEKQQVIKTISSLLLSSKMYSPILKPQLLYFP